MDTSEPSHACLFLAAELVNISVAQKVCCMLVHCGSTLCYVYM
jgi:hypothetical protein